MTVAPAPSRPWVALRVRKQLEVAVSQHLALGTRTRERTAGVNLDHPAVDLLPRAEPGDPGAGGSGGAETESVPSGILRDRHVEPRVGARPLERDPEDVHLEYVRPAGHE